MKTKNISGSLRENVGKKDASLIRREGLVPCVVYGGSEQVYFSIDSRELDKLINTPEKYLINLEVNNSTYRVIIQDYQIHKVTDKLIHVDFLEVTEDKPIKVSLPIKLVGVSKGVLAGGKIVKKLRYLKIKALLNNIPDNIEVDISDLDIGDAFKVKDVKYAGLEFLDVKNNVIVKIASTRASATTTEAPAK